MFDSVCHTLLILKLEFYGVKGSMLNRLKIYLHNKSSIGLGSRHGAPQGSVLGPLQLNVYINNFPCIINKVSNTILFADDTNILVSSDDLNELNSKIKFSSALYLKMVSK